MGMIKCRPDNCCFCLFISPIAKELVIFILSRVLQIIAGIRLELCLGVRAVTGMENMDSTLIFSAWGGGWGRSLTLQMMMMNNGLFYAILRCSPTSSNLTKVCESENRSLTFVLCYESHLVEAWLSEDTIYGIIKILNEMKTIGLHTDSLTTIWRSSN